MPAYHDLESSDNPEVPKYKDTEASDNPEVPVSGSKYGRKTHKTPEYFRTMDIYVKNIGKNDKNTWKNIYKEIDAPYIGGVKNFPKMFLDQCKNYPNEPHKIPSETKNNIKNISLKKVYMRR